MALAMNMNDRYLSQYAIDKHVVLVFDSVEPDMHVNRDLANG